MRVRATPLRHVRELERQTERLRNAQTWRTEVVRLQVAKPGPWTLMPDPDDRDLHEERERAEREIADAKRAMREALRRINESMTW